MPRKTLMPIAIAMLVPTAPMAQPSFDCGAARTATERAICDSPGLADLEVQMVGVYEELADRIGAKEARDIADVQLQRRQDCEGDRACIERQLLTTIGIFRAEGRAAASPPTTTTTTAQATAEPNAALSDLRQALSSSETDTEPTADRASGRFAALEAGFERLPDYRQRLVQGRLRDAGFLSGPIDGLWGASSAEGLDAFLRAADGRGVSFAVQRDEGADMAYRFIASDLFHAEFLSDPDR